MRRIIALSIVCSGLLLGVMGSAPATASGPPVPNYNPCQWANVGSPKKIAKCVKGNKMSRKAKRCLVGMAVTTAGVAVGGIIAATAARAIAGGIFTAGVASCYGAIISG